MTMATAGLALVVWTLIIAGWLYSTRIPAIKKARISMRRYRRARDLADHEDIPEHAKHVADNYNHLHEQPVLFYFLVLYSQGYGVADGLNVALAWGYVLIRVLHSLEQCLRNKVMVRFSLFMVGTLLLAIITLRNMVAAIL